MSERKVLQKYYPPDFDPSKITRTKAPKGVDKKLPTVRLMAPFPMKCTACGEYIYRGRKFNARKETIEGERYLNIQIYRFYIKCTRCSGAITFKTDPKNMDYTCESGAMRSFEKWRQTGEENQNKLETEEEMLDRLEAEAAAEGGPMAELESKVHDAKTEMEIADALDEIRTRNARISRVEGKEGQDAAVEMAEKARRNAEMERSRVEEEDERAAKRAFGRLDEDIEVPMESAARRPMSGLRNEMFADEEEDTAGGPSMSTAGGADGVVPTASNSTTTTTTTKAATTKADNPPAPTFKRVVKKKKDFSAALGIKKKPPQQQPSLV